MSSWVPLDPTAPPDKLVIPRRRPGSVMLAGVLLYGSGALGLLSAAALLIAAESVVRGFRREASGLGVGANEASEIANAVRTVLLSTGLGALAFAVLSFFLARGVLRRNEAARIGALAIAVGSLGCGVVRTSVTAFGGSVDWTVAVERARPPSAARSPRRSTTRCRVGSSALAEVLPICRRWATLLSPSCC